MNTLHAGICLYLAAEVPIFCWAFCLHTCHVCSRRCPFIIGHSTSMLSGLSHAAGHVAGDYVVLEEGEEDGVHGAAASNDHPWWRFRIRDLLVLLVLICIGVIIRFAWPKLPRARNEPLHHYGSVSHGADDCLDSCPFVTVSAKSVVQLRCLQFADTYAATISKFTKEGGICLCTSHDDQWTNYYYYPQNFWGLNERFGRAWDNILAQCHRDNSSMTFHLSPRGLADIDNCQGQVSPSVIDTCPGWNITASGVAALQRLWHRLPYYNIPYIAMEGRAFGISAYYKKLFMVVDELFVTAIRDTLDVILRDNKTWFESRDEVEVNFKKPAKELQHIVMMEITLAYVDSMNFSKRDIRDLDHIVSNLSYSHDSHANLVRHCDWNNSQDIAVNHYQKQSVQWSWTFDQSLCGCNPMSCLDYPEEEGYERFLRVYEDVGAFLESSGLVILVLLAICSAMHRNRAGIATAWDGCIDQAGLCTGALHRWWGRLVHRNDYMAFPHEGELGNIRSGDDGAPGLF